MTNFRFFIRCFTINIKMIHNNLISKLQNTFTPLLNIIRNNTQLAPRQRKYKKAQRGNIPVRIGGSQKGNFLTKGQYGIQIQEGAILTDSQLIACSNILKRKIK